MFNIYSVGHFLQWFLVGYKVLHSWPIFFIISISWEFLETILPFQFAVETIENKFSDIIFNCLGFYIGNNLKDN